MSFLGKLEFVFFGRERVLRWNLIVDAVVLSVPVFHRPDAGPVEKAKYWWVSDNSVYVLYPETRP